MVHGHLKQVQGHDTLQVAVPGERLTTLVPRVKTRHVTYTTSPYGTGVM